jgi:hypothetical protein
MTDTVNKNLNRGTGNLENTVLSVGEPTIMNAPVGLSQQALFDRFVLCAMDQQAFLQQTIGGQSWSINLERGQLVFESNITFSVQVLGGFSHSDKTWTWAWHSSQTQWPASVVVHAQQLKAFGEANDLMLFNEDPLEVPFESLHKIGVVVSGLFPDTSYFIADDGQTALLLNLSEIVLPRIKGPQFDMRIRSTILQTMLAHDFNHAVAIEHFFNANGMSIIKTGNQLVGSIDGSFHVAEFDGLGRLTSLGGSNSTS